MDGNWYCIQSHPNQEAIANKHLKQQEFKTFYPRELLEIGKETSLFTGYLFAFFNLNNPNWKKIPNTLGVKRLICANAHYPIPIPWHVIFLLKMQYPTEIADKRTPIQKFEVGASVQLVSGVYKDFVGIIERTKKQRLDILISVFNREVRTSVERNQVVSVV